MTEEKTIIKIEHETFDAKQSSLGMAVYSARDVTHYSDGSRSFQMRFPICVITDYMDEPESVAQLIADALNAAEGRPRTETPPPTDQHYRKGEAA